jgi:acetolactate synthase-1/2/3 large subunit
MTETKTGAQLFVEALEAEGVRHVFGVPGEENLDFLEALRTSSIRLVVTRHEQAAGFMAATVGRLTGRAGIALSTLGPGATNLVTAAAYANLGAMPMMMITGQKPIKTSKQGHFQIVDVVGMMRPRTKSTRSLMSAGAIPARVREGLRLAEEERPGAVHLELAEDIARETAQGAPIPRTEGRRPVADEHMLARAIDRIQAARRPLLMIGAGANRKATAPMLRAFAERTGIPFFSSQMGKGVLDETQPGWIGTAAHSAGDFVHRAVDASDLVIVVGHDVVEKPPFLMGDGRRSIIHVDFSSAEIDPVYYPEIEVVGDIANTAWRLAEGITPQRHWDFAPTHDLRDGLLRHLARDENDPRFPIHPSRLVAEVRRAMPDSGIVCLDNGMYKLWFARHYRCRAPNTLLLDNALATMGAGLPSAIAAKLLHPEKRVLAVCGDGGFLMGGQDLETAVRLGLDLTVVIVRDDGYGMIRQKQADMGLTEYGMQLGNPDFVMLAQAFGATGHRPGSPEEFAATLAASAKGGVHVIDLPIDYSANSQLLGDLT